MNLIDFEPKVFNNQREAYWYRKGLVDAKEMFQNMIDGKLNFAGLNYLDHLPVGEQDNEGDF